MRPFCKVVTIRVRIGRVLRLCRLCPPQPASSSRVSPQRPPSSCTHRWVPPEAPTASVWGPHLALLPDTCRRVDCAHILAQLWRFLVKRSGGVFLSLPVYGSSTPVCRPAEEMIFLGAFSPALGTTTLVPLCPGLPSCQSTNRSSTLGIQRSSLQRIHEFSMEGTLSRPLLSCSQMLVVP